MGGGLQRSRAVRGTWAMRYLTIIVPAIVVLPLGLSAAVSQQAGGWVGQRVITKAGTVLKVGNQVVDDAGRSKNLTMSGYDRNAFRIYRVEHVQGTWLWLKSEAESVAGWARAEQVIPYDQAVDYFTAQIKALPDTELYNHRGIVRNARGEHELAIADFNEAIRLDPRNEAAYLNRGLAWSYRNDPDKAIADYNEALRLDPSYSDAYYSRGNDWRSKQEFDKAIADYTQAIRLDPTFALAYNNRGFAWSEKKDYDRAITDYDEAIRLAPESPLPYTNRIVAWTAKVDDWIVRNQYDQVIAGYGALMRLNPRDPTPYNGRAWLRATCPDARYRDGKKALEDALRACQLGEYSRAGDVDTLAAAYAESGDFDSAVRWQEKAERMLPDDDTWKKGYGARLELYRARKPYREAPAHSR
jgi:tetratricopeptide (TPR) repeat protein